MHRTEILNNALTPIRSVFFSKNNLTVVGLFLQDLSVRFDVLVIVVVMAAAVVAGVVEPPRVAGGNVTVAVVVAVAFVPSLDLETHLEQKRGFLNKGKMKRKNG